jgi:hypothetical protein
VRRPGEAGTLLQEVGDILRGKGLVDTGGFHGNQQTATVVFGQVVPEGLLKERETLSSVGKEIKIWELSRDPKSSEQFVELNRCHRDIETQLARSSASLSMIPIGSQVASI